MNIEEFLAEWYDDSPTLLVHTSGSTGAPKPMWVEKRRMEASARITCDFLGLHEGDTALLCMSLDYIAGKMMVVRSIVKGLRLTVVPPSGHPFKMRNEELRIKHYDFSASILHSSLLTFNDSFSLVAMVPMQVWNTLQVAEERQRLMATKHLIIGGGAIDEALAAELRTFPNAVWSTYGMTETLSHIALRRLNGPEATEWYTPFPGVTLSQTADGCLIIDAPAVHDGPLVTNDIVEFYAPSSTLSPPPSPLHAHSIPFRIIGRKDNVICSGGVKIQAEEVERRLKAHLDAPFLITKCRDAKFGEAVVLLTEGDVSVARDCCWRLLPKFWQPRHYRQVQQIPWTASDKPARSEAHSLAELLIN